MVRAAGKPTTVLLVRHGQTATTGRLLPGRAPGLHLSDDGRRQADADARRIGGLARFASVGPGVDEQDDGDRDQRKERGHGPADAWLGHTQMIATLAGRLKS